MQAIPIRRKGAPDFDIFVILEDDNLGRLKQYDPGEIDTLMLGAPWNGLRLRRIVLAYANPEEAARIPALMREGRTREVIDLLTRGWKFRPEMGDGQYLNIGGKPS